MGRLLDGIRQRAVLSTMVVIEDEKVTGTRRAVQRRVSALWPDEAVEMLKLVEAAVAWGVSTTPKEDRETQEALVNAVRLMMEEDDGQTS